MTRDACPPMLGLATGALVLLAAAHALALEVQITTVRASEHGPSDAQLIDLRPRLRRLVGYRSFQVVGKERRRCAVPKAMRDQAVVMSVKLMDGSRALVDTDVRLQNRGVMLFGVGQDSRAAEGALIIMLRAED